MLNYQNSGLENVPLGSVQSDFGTARNAFRQQDYTEQLRRLETYVRDHANDAASNLVLAYHYLVINQPQAAKAKLERVLELQPRDQVARQLLTGIVGTEQNGVPPPDESMLSNQPTEKFQADLTGTWETTRNGAPIHLSFQPNGEFIWSVGSGDQAHTITGRFSVNSGTLVMIDGQGEAMTAHVIALSPDTFYFSMVGAPQEDPGVKFERRF